MKAAVFLGRQDIRIMEVPVREPEADEVTVKIEYCGVCGTDLHIFQGEEGSAKTNPPLILGHEMSGTVVKTGSAVTALKAGDRVCIDPNMYCGECYYCRSGKEHFCDKMVGAGTTVDGGFAEYSTLKSKMVMPIGEKLSFEEAAFAEPVACCLHGMDLTEVLNGDTVLIIGGGNIGLIMIQLARISGAAKIVLVEPDEPKRQLGLVYGADAALHPDDDIPRLCRDNGIVRFDRVIECVGKTETIHKALAMASKGATVMMFGLTAPGAKLEIYPFEVFRKELKITASFVNPYTQARAVDLLAGGRVRVKELISEIVPLEQLVNVLTESRYRKMSKVLIRP